MSDLPSPPDSLPNSLADGLPKQDDDTLRQTRRYIDALLEYRAESIDEEDLPPEAEPVEESSGKGTVVKEKVKCGDETCKCASGNPEDLHGPYLYRYYREDGKMKSEYEGKP